MAQAAQRNDFEKVICVAAKSMMGLKTFVVVAAGAAVYTVHGNADPLAVSLYSCLILLRNGLDPLHRLPLHGSGFDRLALALGVVQPAGGLLLWGGEGSHKCLQSGCSAS